MNKTRSRRNVLVSGGGITGLTTALCLARAGFRTEIFEKAEGFETVGAGIQLSPNALNILDDLGLVEQLKNFAVAPSAIRVMSATNGSETTKIPLGSTIIEKYGVPYLVVHRADLHQVLARAVHDNPDTQLHLNSSVEDVAIHANGVTGMIFENGQMKEYPASALIAADGVWSKLRHSHFKEEPASYSGLIAWRGLISTEQLPGSHDLENTQLWLAPQSHAVSYPIRNGRHLNVVVITPGKPGTDDADDSRNWSQSATATELKQQLTGWCDEFRSLMQYRTRWTRWPLYHCPDTRNWLRGPTAMAGDAAHAMLPFAAQGAVMGIEDAAVLGSCMSKALDRDLPVEAAFAEYQEQRTPRIRRAERLAHSNGQIYHMGQPFATARNVAMKVLGGKRLLERQNWLYGWQAD
ncbi:MAG: FAD-dependent monooxygenase [Rhizobiaceae bacterium]